LQLNIKVFELFYIVLTGIQTIALLYKTRL